MDLMGRHNAQNEINRDPFMSSIMEEKESLILDLQNRLKEKSNEIEELIREVKKLTDQVSELRKKT